ncbi:MAG: ThiF family adenylyltransferase [Anaerolineaceae bacterium]|nr:ThiF family adenylyltransferase [Anaerolineaceae bacterium]
MRYEIVFPAGAWPGVLKHLLGQGSDEQLAFLLAGTARGSGWRRLLVREAIAVPAGAFVRQTGNYLAVKPEFSQGVLRRCYEEGLSLIEAHSHPFAGRDVAFSALDLANEELKFRYVASRIPHVTHATLVVGQDSLDAHVWDRRSRRTVPVDCIRILDQPITDLLPTSHELPGENVPDPAPWLHRQALAFGSAAQQRMERVRVGVVGCGGTGSLVVQMLAHLGVRRLVLVDPDVVEVSNLNRLVGARPADARNGRYKVDVARRLARSISHNVQVRALPLSVADPAAVAALKGLDLLFGCTDNDGSRLILNRMAVQYLIPYLDLGAGLQAAPGGRLSAGGGQVRLVRPGSFCLACIDGIDRVRAARDLQPLLDRRRHADRGYVQDNDLPTPAVLFLNCAVAALAMAEFVNLWTGYRAPTPLAYFDLLASRLAPAQAERQPDCIACGEGGSLGLGDLEPLPGVATTPPAGIGTCAWPPAPETQTHLERVKGR